MSAVDGLVVSTVDAIFTQTCSVLCVVYVRNNVHMDIKLSVRFTFRFRFIVFLLG